MTSGALRPDGWLLRVRVLRQFGWRDSHLYAVRENLRLRNPEQRIQHDLAKVLIPEIGVIAPAGKTDGASTVLPLAGPGDEMSWPILERTSGFHRP